MFMRPKGRDLESSGLPTHLTYHVQSLHRNKLGHHVGTCNMNSSHSCGEKRPLHGRLQCSSEVPAWSVSLVRSAPLHGRFHPQSNLQMLPQTRKSHVMLKYKRSCQTVAQSCSERRRAWESGRRGHTPGTVVEVGEALSHRQSLIVSRQGPFGRKSASSRDTQTRLQKPRCLLTSPKLVSMSERPARHAPCRSDLTTADPP